MMAIPKNSISLWGQGKNEPHFVTSRFLYVKPLLKTRREQSMFVFQEKINTRFTSVNSEERTPSKVLRSINTTGDGVEKISEASQQALFPVWLNGSLLKHGGNVRDMHI